MYFAELSTIPKFCAVLNMEIVVNVNISKCSGLSQAVVGVNFVANSDSYELTSVLLAMAFLFLV